MKNNTQQTGFTLMELILVIALIGFLAVTILVVVDPARRIGETRNSLRSTDAQNIKRAIESYAVDNDALPSAISALIDNNYYMIAAAGDSSGGTVSCTAVGNITKVDITNGASTLFNYLATIPVDPEQTTPYSNGTGYYFKKNGNIIVDVKPCNVYAWAGSGSEEATPVITAISFPNYGSESTLNSTAVDYDTSLDTIDSTHAIMMYDRYTKVLTMTGASIAANTQSTAANAATDELDITYLTTNKVVNVSNINTAPNTVTNIGTTSANPTTWETPQNMNSVLPRYPKIETLDSTHVIVAYADNTNSNIGKVRVGTVGASSITWGTEATFNNGGTYAIGLAVLDSTHFVVTFRDTGDTNNGNAIAGSVSGTTISWDTAETTFDSGVVYGFMDAVALDSSKFIVTYIDNSNSDRATAIVGSVSGGVISFGSKLALSSSACNATAIDKIDSTHAIIAYSAATGVAKADVATVSGDVITLLAAPVNFDGGNVAYPSVTTLDTNNFLIGYKDASESGYPKAIVGTITWE